MNHCCILLRKTCKVEGMLNLDRCEDVLPGQLRLEEVIRTQDVILQSV